MHEWFPLPDFIFTTFKRLASLLNALLDVDQSHTVSFSLTTFYFLIHPSFSRSSDCIFLWCSDSGLLFYLWLGFHLHRISHPDANAYFLCSLVSFQCQHIIRLSPPQPFTPGWIHLPYSMQIRYGTVFHLFISQFCILSQIILVPLRKQGHSRG